MTLLMTAWCKFKFTMLCKHVIVYYGWHVWLQSTMAAWGHKLKVSMSCITERQKNITGRTIETSTNGYKDHRKYETVIVSSRSVWTIIMQNNFIKQYKM
jgi:hypothetical protein